MPPRQQVDERRIRELAGQKLDARAIAERLGTSRSVVNKVLRGARKAKS
jgi:DNA-binding GntR family transcriptional regulator